VQAQDERLIQARTLCFERAGETPDIFINGSAEPYKILTPVESFSNRFTCKLVNNMAVFYKVEGVDDHGDPKRVVVAKTKVSPSLKEVLFYFAPTKSEGDILYHILVMPDSVDDFPLGSTRLLNLSAGDVAFKVGEHLKRLKSREMALMGAVHKRNEYNMAPLICKMNSVNGVWMTICETQARFTDRKRLLIVSYVNPETHQPLLKVYKDLPVEKIKPLSR
jgi:hypothetical protein